MKRLVFYFLILLSGCFMPSARDHNKQEIPASKKDSKLHMALVYPCSDVNGDGLPDTAFVNYDVIIDADSTFSTECGFRQCEIPIKFNSKISPLIIENSQALCVQGTVDINHDGANEILVFSHWMRPAWGDIEVYSLQNKKWEKTGTASAFFIEPEHYDNRIIQRDKIYFLLGDKWDDTIGVLFRKDTIKISG